MQAHDNPEQRKRAVDLTAADLGRWVSVIDHAGRAHTGRLDRIELSIDRQTRVVLRISAQGSVNEEDGGGWYWSTFANECFVDRDAQVSIGKIAPLLPEGATR